MRTMLRWRTVSVCLGFVCAHATGCASATVEGHVSTSGGTDDGGSVQVAPFESDGGSPSDSGDASTSLAEDAETIESGGYLPEGVFVAPTGSDSASGTASKPLLTVAAGVAMAVHLGKPLYLCTGTTYPENVTLKNAITIDGSRDCTQGWASTTNATTIAPTSGVPLTIAAGAAEVSLTYLHVIAASNYEPGASSIALLASSSTNVSITNSEVSAGSAGDGVTPGSPTPSTDPAPAGWAGESCPAVECSSDTGACAVVYHGGAAPYGSCYGPGGIGGAGGNVDTGVVAQPGQAGLPASVGGTGGAADWVVPGKGAGLPGNPGTLGGAGIAATLGFGSVSASGYSPTNTGTAGSAGSPGGGGGGGAGGYSGMWGDPSLCNLRFIGGGGGQGGYGGCGGAGAPGGGGGGASIAVLSIASAIDLDNVILDTGTGGDGGNSVAGAAGQPGGQGGAGGIGSYPTPITGSCIGEQAGGTADNGGPGGTGGKGGPGGPGGGGPSIAIVATTTAPTLKAVTFNLAGGGTGGRALEGGDGAPGVTSDTWFIGVPDAG